MTRPELAHLEVLAEVDALVDRLGRWAAEAPDWRTAEKCRALVRRLTQRAVGLRIRFDAPLVVATLGGSGTGKSALVNALLGAEVVQTGRARPTTTRPTLIVRPGLTPEMLGVDPASVECVARDLPALRDLVLVDCPDPDTTEVVGSRQSAVGSGQSAVGSAKPQAVVASPPLPPSSSPPLAAAPSGPLPDNLARLRAILPHCDVLLVTATQQKYRSARVIEELAAAAPGAQVVFVQTHADTDADVRNDWRQALENDLPSPIGRGANSVPSPFGRGAGGEGGGASGQWPVVGGQCSSAIDELPTHGPQSPAAPSPALTLALSQGERGQEPRIFFVDSLRALADAQANLQPRGEFADLVDLLTRQMAGAAAHRIRRTNFLDLVADTLDSCAARIDEAMPGVREAQNAIGEQRAALARQIAGQTRTELLANRRQWESRLLGQAAARWGFSPFALVLRAYQGLGGLFSGALLYRARTPAQVALWGAMEGARTWRRHRRNQVIRRPIAVGGWQDDALRSAAVILDGYASEAGFERRAVRPDVVAGEAVVATAGFAARASADLESLMSRLARRHTGWLTRWRYELLLLAMLGALLYRLGKNFFYDSWLAPKPGPVYGVDFYVSAGFWLLLWCLVLLWAFTSRLRSGLRGEMAQLAAAWDAPDSAAGLFAQLESDCRRVEHFRQELLAIRGQVDRLRRQVAAGS
jgi:hypothetical protein